MAGVSRSHTAPAVGAGVVPGKSREGLNKERTSTVSSLRNEQGRQKLSDRETDEQAKQVKPVGAGQSAEPFPTRDNGKSDVGTWEAVFARENMQNALKRVESNKGAAGIDGMKVEDLRGYLKAHWQEVRETLESGKYRPSPVRRVEIPKPDGGVRQLGIPTVIVRLIQQAIAQVLVRCLKKSFHRTALVSDQGEVRTKPYSKVRRTSEKATTGSWI
jgi:hypothetical protein